METVRFFIQNTTTMRAYIFGVAGTLKIKRMTWKGSRCVNGTHGATGWRHKHDPLTFDSQQHRAT